VAEKSITEGPRLQLRRLGQGHGIAFGMTIESCFSSTSQFAHCNNDILEDLHNVPGSTAHHNLAHLYPSPPFPPQLNGPGFAYNDLIRSQCWRGV
jgi:hypothetical protein